MDLYLVRHADAEPTITRDFDRNLTDKGRKQSARLAVFLKTLKVRPDRIATSPLVRARQTAAILQETLDAPGGLAEDQRLACGMTPETGSAILWDHEGDGTLLLVGHEPDMSGFASHLVGMESAYGFQMKKAACACIEVETPGFGGSMLRWLAPPKVVASLASK